MDYSFSDFLEENRTKIILIIVFIIISIALMIGSSLLGKGNKEDELNYRLESLGVVYYEEIYYDSIDGEKEEYLDILKDIGIKVDLGTLILNVYNEDPEFFINEKTNKKCDYDKSYVVIYPKEPYQKKDYEIEYQLECGF